MGSSSVAIHSLDAVLSRSRVVLARMARYPLANAQLDPTCNARSCACPAPADFYAIGLLWTISNILWLILIYALCERMRAAALHLSLMALVAASAGTAAVIAQATILNKVIGMIVQAKDVSAILAANTVYAGLEIMYNHIYGWVCLLIGFAVLKTRAFSRTPGWLFVIPGALYVFMSSYPMGGLLVWGGPVAWNCMLLSLISILWFGIVMLREEKPRSATGEMAALA
jgi:hypothetical protein